MTAAAAAEAATVMATVAAFGDDNYDDACQRPLRWEQLAS